MASKRTQTGQRSVKSPTPSVGSSILRENKDSEMNFDNIKQAADEAGKDLWPTENKKFIKYCEGLEKAMKDTADLSGVKIIAAVDHLIQQLSPFRESKPRITIFYKKLDNLKKMMIDGGRFQLTPSSTNDKTEKKLFDEMKKANKYLADLVKELQIRHTELIGNIPGVLLDNADSPVALVSDLRHLSISFAMHIEQNERKAETMGINKVSLAKKKLSVVVNQWLFALKTDIEKGKWTASFDGDTPDELITTRDLLRDITKCLTKNSERENTIRNEHKNLTSQLQDSEKRILKIWKLLGNGSDASPEPRASDALSKLETFVTETKQSFDKQTKEAKSLEEGLEKLEEQIEELSKMKIKQMDKIVSPSQRVKDISQAITKWGKEDKSGNDSDSKAKQLSSKITKVWLHIKSGNDKTKDNGGDSIVMLEELENWLKENKALIDSLRSTDLEIKAELELLKQDLDSLDETAETVVKERKDDQEVVKIIKKLRRTVKEKQNELFSATKFRGKDSESKAKQLSSKITKVWLQIKGGNDKTKDNGGDSIAMLEELENWLKENKALIDRYWTIEEAAHQEIKLLKQDIETLHDDKRPPVIYETKTDPALVRSLKQLRKDLLLKKHSSQKNVSESQRMHDMGCDEFRSNVTDVCAFCATDEKLNPAIYFCKDCSKFGRYICGICNKNHGRFTNNHNVERIFTV